MWLCLGNQKLKNWVFVINNHYSFFFFTHSIVAQVLFFVETWAKMLKLYLSWVGFFFVLCLFDGITLYFHCHSSVTTTTATATSVQHSPPIPQPSHPHAPVVPFGMDLYHWESSGREPLPVEKVRWASHRSLAHSGNKKLLFMLLLSIFLVKEKSFFVFKICQAVECSE